MRLCHVSMSRIPCLDIMDPQPKVLPVLKNDQPLIQFKAIWMETRQSPIGDYCMNQLVGIPRFS